MPLAIYIPQPMLDQLRDLAEADRRSVSMETQLILEDALKARSRKSA